MINKKIFTILLLISIIIFTGCRVSVGTIENGEVDENAIYSINSINIMSIKVSLMPENNLRLELYLTNITGDDRQFLPYKVSIHYGDESDINYLDKNVVNVSAGKKIVISYDKRGVIDINHGDTVDIYYGDIKIYTTQVE